ncbi:MAG: site-specific integrase [Nitrospira sp.]|nr:site-specific integrase [Nitrospira sp.]
MARKGGVDRGITRRKNRDGWWVRLYANGRQQWFKCDTKSQAKALYGRLKAEIREATYFPEKYAPKKDITLRAWLRRCLDGSSNRNRINEVRYNRRWSLWFGLRSLSEITTDELRQHQRRLQLKMRPRPARAPKAWRPTRHWSDATINRHFAYLKHIYNLALKDGKVTRNPVAGVKLFPEVSKTRFLSDKELTRLRGVMNLKDWQIVALAVETALRREELFGLRWEHVDCENGVLTLPMPKGGKTRYVPLSDQAKAILRSFESWTCSPWVFPGLPDPMKSMDSRAFLRRSFEPALRRAGIAGASWHTLRHTAASRRVMAGVDLVSVKEILGHRNIQTTMRYSHLDPRHLRDAVNRGSLRETVTSGGNTDEASAEPTDFMVRPAGIEPATLSLEG